MEITKICQKNKKKENKTKRTCVYCRVSTNNESQDGSIESQQEYFKKYVSSKANLKLVGMLVERGYSGLQDKRPQFDKMIRMCRKGLVDLILCKSISRFSRNASECLKIVDELSSLGIVAFFEKEGIYSSDDSFHMILHILASLAQEEIRSTSENISWAYEKNAELGNPTRFCPYGYKKINKEWVIDKNEAKSIKLIYLLASEGYSIVEITDKLNKFEERRNSTKRWTKYSVRFAINNEVYKGDILTGKTKTIDYMTGKQVRNHGEYKQVYIRNHHQPIIDYITFNKIRKQYSRSSL